MRIPGRYLQSFWIPKSGQDPGLCNFLWLPGDSAVGCLHFEKNYYRIISIRQWRKTLAAVGQLTWCQSYHHIPETREVSKYLSFCLATPLLKNTQWLHLSSAGSSPNSSPCHSNLDSAAPWCLSFCRMEISSPRLSFLLFVSHLFFFIKNHQNLIGCFPYISHCPIHQFIESSARSWDKGITVIPIAAADEFLWLAHGHTTGKWSSNPEWWSKPLSTCVILWCLGEVIQITFFLRDSVKYPPELRSKPPFSSSVNWLCLPSSKVSVRIKGRQVPDVLCTVSGTIWVTKWYYWLDAIPLETHIKSFQAGEMKIVWLLRNDEIKLPEKILWHQSTISPFSCGSEVSLKNKDVRNHPSCWNIFYLLFKE